MSQKIDVVTGSFTFIGRYITQQLLSQNKQVKTLTNHPNKSHPFGKEIQAYPYNFEQPEKLIKTLQGAETLYNHYWIRFEYGEQTFEKALANTKTLFDCAVKAGVKKIVHISVTGASEKSHLPYYRGKGIQEKLLIETGIPYAIIRPTLVFGIEEILLNNIVWMIRNFPFFPIFGSGEFIIQPVFVNDLASIAIDAANKSNSIIMDAIGSEKYTFKELIQLISYNIGEDSKLINVNPDLGCFFGKIIGLFVNDIVLTKDEIKGIMDSILSSQQFPNCQTKFSQWLRDNYQIIGQEYRSQIQRNYRF